MQYKICIWTSIPSPHQKYFFEALSRQKEVDLCVQYFQSFPEDRIELGWKVENSILYKENYETENPHKAIESIPDWKKRIHIIPGISHQYSKKLLNILIENKVEWIHWSERSGIVLAEKLGFSSRLFKIFSPLYTIKNFSYARKINQYALGAFSQGILAKKDFISWGVYGDKIEDLFYTIEDMNKNIYSIEDKVFDNIDKKIFLYVGSLSKRKGISILIQAYSKLKNKDEWSLVFIGSSPDERKYFEQVGRLNLLDSIFFLGSKPIEDIGYYMEKSDVFVLPTLFDGWGAVLNEAAMMSKPIISTDQCGAAFHILKTGENGIRVKSGNIKDLSTALNFYIENPEKIVEHGKKSYEIYRDFIPEKNVERFMMAIEKWKKVSLSYDS